MSAQKASKDIEPATETNLMTDLEINKAVKFINEKANEALYKGSIEIGQYILENFFDNNIKIAT